MRPFPSVNITPAVRNYVYIGERTVFTAWIMCTLGNGQCLQHYVYIGERTVLCLHWGTDSVYSMDYVYIEERTVFTA